MRYIANVCSRCLLRLRGAATSSVSNLSFDNVRNKANGLFTFTGRNLFPSNQVHIRSFTSSPQEDPQSPPQLMQMRAYTWPSFFKTIKNSLLANFILKNYYDGDFDMEEFINGSLQAVEVVSTLISEGHLKELSGLVTEEAISEIKQNLNCYSLSQRLDLKISKEDIYFKFAYEIGLILPDRDKGDKKQYWPVLLQVFINRKALVKNLH